MAEYTATHSGGAAEQHLAPAKQGPADRRPADAGSAERKPKLAERAQTWIEGRHILWGVAIASLAETTVVPIPIEIVLIPIMLTNRRRLWAIAAAALLGCLAGATIGYFVGMGAFETIAEPILEATNLTEEFQEQRDRLAGNAFRYTLVVALTPVPFQLAFLGAGAANASFASFFAAAAIGRGVRYLGLALLVVILGNAAGPWLDRHKYKVAIYATAAILAVYIAQKLIFPG